MWEKLEGAEKHDRIFCLNFFSIKKIVANEKYWWLFYEVFETNDQTRDHSQWTIMCGEVSSDGFLFCFTTL